MNYRIFVEKKPSYGVEAESLLAELNENMGLNIKQLRLLNVYDLFDFSPELLEECRYTVFGERVTDTVTDSCPTDNYRSLAVEYLPGQFDQRAASAVDCVHLLDPNAEVTIRSAKLYLFDRNVGDRQMKVIANYLINPVEAWEKDMTVLDKGQQVAVNPVGTIDGFRALSGEGLTEYCKSAGLAMNSDDLAEVVKYFNAEGRDPYYTELAILDTYWSDHCRHTTFTTDITDITVDDSFIKSELEESIGLWKRIRTELGRDHKSLCLMDLATIGARYLRKQGLLDDMEQSEENNACSIFVTVDVDGVPERWLLQFKNETHNHPTEIEPFGGAATCLGGAIRDPLSGRSYVYQAMRVTGAGNIYLPVGETMKGKLPQKVISRKAAAGYSSYGNQIGLATTHVREIYDESYVAKRLEVGAVVGAVKADNVRRESPAEGDVVLLLGGRTGRDGIGGATGSSKEHTERSLRDCGSEVQKGNPTEERKLERLFRRKEVTEMIKKSNDFGAGGVSVAIGELTDGLDIYLDRVPVKYSGLNATELAISESQERMAVVVEAKDRLRFEQYCREENIEVTYVADVTSTRRMRMFYGTKMVVDLKREFIDSAGAPHYTTATIGAVVDKDPFERTVEGNTLEEQFTNNLRDRNVCSERGLIEMFDSTIGRSTVLMPFGGRTQRTETQVSVQKLPVGNHYTDTASIMAFGYNPAIASWSPYHGAAYAVADAVAKVVAAGGEWSGMRFSYQEYFERMHNSHSWGKPLSALLGALKMQVELGLPSIGGKDSMSGTFDKINVPPMLMAFGITTVDANRVISPEFKSAGHYIYIIRHTPKADRMPDCEGLKANFDLTGRLVGEGTIVAGYAVGNGGVGEAVAKMSMGNCTGCTITLDSKALFDYSYGSIVVESTRPIDFPAAQLLGHTTDRAEVVVNGVAMAIDELAEANRMPFATIYPDRTEGGNTVEAAKGKGRVCRYEGEKIERPVVYLPVFPGTNCDYDTAKAFECAGAATTTSVFCNLLPEQVTESIEQMASHIAQCQILVLSGGFSAGDEPDGSGKFIADILNNRIISAQIEALIARGGLILGICNGFQALVKSGLLPYGHTGSVVTDSPTLFRNDLNRHISHIVTTRVGSTDSPWLSSFATGECHSIAVSHGEGKFTVSEQMAAELFANGQVAFQYADPEGNPTTRSPFNPNGSSFAIEGIIDRTGQILGKMGHSERWERNLYKNIAGNRRQELFENAVNYFRKKQ